MEELSGCNRTPDAEKLYQMSYSDLKKLAKKHGVKGNMKAEKIIKSLMSISSEDLLSFATPLQARINSSRKNKENKFDEDKMTPLATPRRGTYTVESPSEYFLAKNKPGATPLKSAGDGFVKAISKPDATPLKSLNDGFGKAKSKPDTTPLKSPATNNFRNSKSRSYFTPLKSSATGGSVRAKSKTDATPLKSPAVDSFFQGKRKLNDTSPESLTADDYVQSKKKLNATLPESSVVDVFTEDMLNVTMCRGSERKLRPRKVSFVTPKKTPQSPKYISLKDRPKTPIASRLSVSKRVSFSTPIGQQQRKSIEKTVRVTPHPHSVKTARDSSSNKKNPSSEEKSAKVKRIQTPSSNKKNSPSEEKSAKVKRIQTPNFKQIHQKAFDKMESIDDYQKRKILNSAKKLGKTTVKVKASKPKSKIPIPFSGIPFIPSATSTIGMNFDFGSRTTRSTASEEMVISQPKIKSTFTAKAGGPLKSVPSKENTMGRKAKAKFDLKASLSRKLGYRPYTGHIKPLSELNTSIPAPPCVHNVNSKESETKISENRSKTRAMLKGVRTNKRFELLMKNRNL